MNTGRHLIQNPPAGEQDLLTGLQHETLLRSALRHISAIPDEQDRTTLLVKALHGMDDNGVKQDAACLLERILPLAELVPEPYAAWRPVIQHGFHYLASELSTARLIPKICQQIFLPKDTGLEHRLALFMQKLPSLQKLGQVLARNPHISPELRKQLLKLEDSINDASYDEIKLLLNSELDGRMQEMQVHIEARFLAEASVSAVLRFCWVDEAEQRIKNGVFKVLKPYVADYVLEETAILQGLAAHLKQTSDEHILRQADLEGLFSDVCSLLIDEIDFRQEQRALLQAESRYREFPQVKTPFLIKDLCSDRVTAMSQVPGVKVTNAYQNDSLARTKLSRQLINTLLIEPMLDAQQEAVFHADPHAGNLLVNEHDGCLGLLDWASTERLSMEDRRHCILLFCGVFLRDARMTERSLLALTTSDPSPGQQQKLRNHIQQYCGVAGWFSLPGMNQLMEILDTGLQSGIHYKRSLLVFRKVLLTLRGVLHDISPNTSVDMTLMYYLYTTLMSRLANVTGWQRDTRTISLPLKGRDAMSLIFSLQTLGFRHGLELGEMLGNGGNREECKITSVNHK